MLFRSHTDRPLIVEAVSVEVIGAAEATDDPAGDMQWQQSDPTRPCKPLGHSDIYTVNAGQNGEESFTAAVFSRQQLTVDHPIEGPAIIVEANSTIVIEPGWSARLSRLNHLILTRVTALARKTAMGTQVDPVRLEIFNNLFMSIAEQMGTTLQNTSHSVNIKERLDFSCAIFDVRGELVANAPHMPVHLGSMGESVQSVIRHHAKMRARR